MGRCGWPASLMHETPCGNFVSRQKNGVLQLIAHCAQLPACGVSLHDGGRSTTHYRISGRSPRSRTDETFLPSICRGIDLFVRLIHIASIPHCVAPSISCRHESPTISACSGLTFIRDSACRKIAGCGFPFPRPMEDETMTELPGNS